MKIPPTEEVITWFLAFVGGSAMMGIYNHLRVKSQNKLDESGGKLNDAQAWEILIKQLTARVQKLEERTIALELEIAERDEYIAKLVRMLGKTGVDVPTFARRRRTNETAKDGHRADIGE